jgi:hypothetical protein
MTLQELPAEEVAARKGLPHEYLEAPSYRSADSDSIGSNADKVSAYGVPMAPKPVSYTAVPLAPPTGSVRRERPAVEDDFGSVIDALRNAASASGLPGPAREAFVSGGNAPAESDDISMGSRSASHSEGRPGFDEQDTMGSKTTADVRGASGGDDDSMVLDLDDIAEGGTTADADDVGAPPDYLYGQRLDEPGYLDTRHVRPRASELPQYADVERADSRNPYLEVTLLRPEQSGPSGEGHTGGYLDVSRGQHASGEGHTGGYLDVSHGRRPTGESDMGGYLDVATRSAVPEDSRGKRVSQAYLDTHIMAPGDASQDPSPSKAPPASTSVETEEDDDFGDLAYVLQAEGQGAEVNMEDFAAQAESMLRRLSVSGRPS